MPAKKIKENPMSKFVTIIIILCFLAIAGQAQFVIKNNTGDVLMQVNGNADVTIGSIDQTGDLTTDNIVVNDGLTYAAGAADGHVLRSNASGAASWALENQRLSLSGNTLRITDGTGTVLNTVLLPTGSDNQNLDSNKSGENVTVDIDRGNSTTFSIQDDDHNPSNELQDLGSLKSGENVTVTITDGTNTSFSIQDDDHSTDNEIQNWNQVIDEGNVLTGVRNPVLNNYPASGDTHVNGILHFGTAIGGFNINRQTWPSTGGDEKLVVGAKGGFVELVTTPQGDVEIHHRLCIETNGNVKVRGSNDPCEDHGEYDPKIYLRYGAPE
jgi:hypothetical protein